MSLQSEVDQVVRQALDANTIVGSVILVAHAGEVVYRAASGLFDREAGAPMRDDAIFRLASFTKPLVAATTLAMIEKGLLALIDPVTKFLPYFTPPFAGAHPTITIEHLLTHTGGIAGGGPAFDAVGVGQGMVQTDLSLDENTRRIAKVDLAHAPGQGWVYGKGLDVLGAVLATIHGGTLGEALAHYVTIPLGLKDTGFIVSDPTRLGPAYGDNPDGPVRMSGTHVVRQRDNKGTISFSVDRVFNPKAFQSGGSGGVGTAGDFLIFLETLRKGGGAILSAQTMAAGTQNRLGALPREPGSGFGHFGGVVTDPALNQTPQSVGTYEWGGIYGHRWFVDPVRAITAVIMTNTAVEGCSGPFPKDVRDAIYRGLI